MKTVAVAGSGLIGLSIAWRLAQSGWSVTVFESGTFGSQASWAGAGMLAPGGEVDAGSPLAVPAVEARRLYPSFVEELISRSGIVIDFQPCGALDLAYSTSDLAALHARADRQATFGIASKPVNAAHIATFWPHVQRHNLAGGRFYPEDAIVDPRHVLSALQIACRDLGVRLLEHSPVQRLAVDSASVTLATAATTQTFETAVIAAGAWSDSIAVAGVPPLPPVEPVKGILLGYLQPEQICGTILRLGHTYVLQRSNGLLIAGASVERLGFDRTIPPHVVARLIGEAAAVLPHLAETTPTQTWSGLRPHAAELRLGPWHSPRLHLAYGHFRNGILLAPWTAARISALLNAS